MNVAVNRFIAIRNHRAGLALEQKDSGLNQLMIARRGKVPYFKTSARFVSSA